MCVDMRGIGEIKLVKEGGMGAPSNVIIFEDRVVTSRLFGFRTASFLPFLQYRQGLELLTLPFQKHARHSSQKVAKIGHAS